MSELIPAHGGCTLILQVMDPSNLPKKAPRWRRERTHGCWCSGWRKTRNGFRIWRRGAWRKPKRGEFRMVADWRSHLL
jgi:hypothetical protein